MNYLSDHLINSGIKTIPELIVEVYLKGVLGRKNHGTIPKGNLGEMPE